MSLLRDIVAYAISPYPGMRKWEAAKRVLAALKAEGVLIEDRDAAVGRMLDDEWEHLDADDRAEIEQEGWVDDWREVQGEYMRARLDAATGKEQP